MGKDRGIWEAGWFHHTNVVPSCSLSWVRGFLEKEGTNGVNYSWPVSERPNNAELNH